MNKRHAVLLYAIAYIITSLLLFSVIFVAPELRLAGIYDTTTIKTDLALSFLGGLFPTFSIPIFTRILKK